MLVGIMGIPIAITIEINIKRETNDVYLKENYLNGNDNIEKNDDYFWINNQFAGEFSCSQESDIKNFT